MATETRKFTTSGMHCPSCSMLIEMNLSDLEGVQSASSDYRTGMTEVTFDTDLVSIDGIVSAIESAGYSAELA